MFTPQDLLDSAIRLMMSSNFDDKNFYGGYCEEVRNRYYIALATVEFEKDLFKEYAYLFEGCEVIDGK